MAKGFSYLRLMTLLPTLLTIGLLGDNDGGSGDGGSGDGGSDGSGGGNSGEGGSGDGGTGSDSDEDEEEDSFDPKKAKRLIANLRRENRKLKTDKKGSDDGRNELLTKLGELLGVKQDGKPGNDETKAQADAKAAEAKAAKIELAIFKAASKPEIGARGDLLLDSRSFMRTVNELDPDSATFGDDVEKAVKRAIKDNPTFAAGPVKTKATRSGGSINGGTGSTDESKLTPHMRLLRAYANSSPGKSGGDDT